jgi:hypothetical protein
VQELAPEPVTAGVPIARIAAQRMADRGEVGPHLVRSPGLQASLDQGVRRQGLEHPEVRAGLPGPAPADCAALGRAVVAVLERGAPSTRAR